MSSAADEGRPCGPLLASHSLGPQPRRLRMSTSSQRANDWKIRRLGQAHQPYPASDAQLLRPSLGKAAASMRAVETAGISLSIAL